jgi:hypothetical protein
MIASELYRVSDPPERMSDLPERLSAARGESCVRM